MASVQIEKGERFLLNKSEDIERVMINLNGKLEADIDMSAFLVGEDGLIQHDADFVFYNSDSRVDPITREYKPYNKVLHGNKRTWRNQTMPISADGSVILSIDNLGYDEKENLGNSKEKDFCDYSEEMHIDLIKVSPNIKEIIFCATIYHGDEVGKTFGDVSDFSIILLNEENDKELCRYNVEKCFSTETAVEAAKLLRNEDDEWEFEAVGKGHHGGMQTLIDIYA